MTKKQKKPSKPDYSNDPVMKAALSLAEQAIAAKRMKGAEYPPEWEDPEFVREKIAPALLNKMLKILPSLLND